MKLWKANYDWAKRPFLWLSLLYLLALLAILRANYYYVDDLGRALMGLRGWLDWSRYVTLGLSVLVQPTVHLTDISPIPQLLAAILMALSGLLVIYTFTGKKEISWPFLAAALPMGLSPWFLACFTYKFDAPYMAVSVLVSVLPFLWWERDEKKFYIASFLCLLAMTMTYQAASGIFVMETVFLAFLSWIRGGNGKSIFLWILRAAMIYVVSLLTFKLFFLRPPIETYISIDVVSPALLPQTFVQNASAYLSIVWQDLNPVTRLFSAATVLFWLLHVRRATKQNRLLTLLAALAFLTVTAVLSYGVYLAFEKPFLSARGLLGMGVWLSFLLISLVAMTEKKGAARWLVLLMAWQLIAGAAAYGNALAEQKRYTDFRVQMVVQDLNTLRLTEDNAIRYHILGDIGKAPLVRNTEEEYPAVKRLIYPTFANGGTWFQFYFYFYHDLALHAEAEGDPLAYTHLPVAVENRYHRIQSDGKDVLISLKASSYESMEIKEWERGNG